MKIVFGCFIQMTRFASKMNVNMRLTKMFLYCKCSSVHKEDNAAHLDLELGQNRCVPVYFHNGCRGIDPSSKSAE